MTLLYLSVFLPEFLYVTVCVGEFNVVFFEGSVILQIAWFVCCWHVSLLCEPCLRVWIWHCMSLYMFVCVTLHVSVCVSLWHCACMAEGSSPSSALLESFAADLWVCHGGTRPSSSNHFTVCARHFQGFAAIIQIHTVDNRYCVVSWLWKAKVTQLGRHLGLSQPTLGGVMLMSVSVHHSVVPSVLKTVNSRVLQRI